MPSPPPPTATYRRTSNGKGIVRAIYAVTGVVDEVQDLILPGAFARTLARRRVKAVWHHEWKDPVGSVLDVEEWPPGDPRFASIPGGSVWPAGAGALVATVQYNLRTTRGRDAYEQVRQWHDNGEAQFSIGYKVPAGGASKRHDQVRIIHDLDLYEISPVLHGAHPMTRSLEVKTAKEEAAALLERKATWSAIELKAAETQAGRGAMIALQLPADVSVELAQPDGTPAAQLHITLAYLGDAAEIGGQPDDLRGIVASAIEGTGPLKGTLGGIGRFPDTGSGVPTWVPVDVPGLSELRQRIVDALADSAYSGTVHTEHGFTPHITLGYDLPDVAPVPSTPVVFDQVAIVLGPDTSVIPLSERPETGPPEPVAPRSVPVPPGESKSAARIVLEAKSVDAHNRSRGNAENLRHWYSAGEGAARIGWGTPGDFDRCVAIASEHMGPEDAKGYCNLRHHDALGIYPATHAAESKSATQIVLEAKSAHPEVAMPAPMPFSFEQLRARLGEAARALLAPDDDDCFVAIEATYPDRVIVSHQDDGQTTTYAIPYTAAGRDIDLGTPTPVELTTVALPVSDETRPVEGAEETDARFVQPTADALDNATALIEMSDAGPDHLQRLKPTVAKLLATLTKKGLPMPNDTARSVPAGSSLDLWDSDYDIEDGWDDEEEDDADTADDQHGGAAPEAGTAPSDGPGPATDAGAPPEDPGEDDQDDDKPVRLNADEVKAALAALTL